MPTTINGIGTHYYGKTDLATRPGTCVHCGSYGNLESYSTRLWFVIVFIPIIPLKRVRILNSCPSCSRHWVANPEEYEMSRQLAVSGALDQYRAEPTVETALVAHAQYLAFHMTPEADAFCQEALEKFPENQHLLLGLASHFDQTGRWEAATPMYEQVLQLKPDSTDARFHLAWRKTNAGKLEESYDLLDYLRQPGAGQSFNLDPLQTLAEAYQKVGQHEKVLELCAISVRENPEIAEQQPFRALVSKSEKAVGSDSSLLAEHPFSWSRVLDTKTNPNAGGYRWGIFGTLVATVFLVGMLWLNEHQRTHRPLHIVSAFAQPIEVSIDGQPPVNVSQRKMFELPEGEHRIQLKGPVNKEIVANLQTSYFSRWFSRPIWVLDVESYASVMVDKIFYSVNPPPPETIPQLPGDVIFVPHVDYPFETPPNSMQIKGKNNVVTKIHVSVPPLPPLTVATLHMSDPDQSALLSFMEGYLERNLNDSKLMALYVMGAKGDESEQRAADFLKSKLWNSPISINVHRNYMNRKTAVDPMDELIPEYDRRLQATPNDAILLYLRGRASSSSVEQNQFFERSLAQEPQQGWAAMGVGYNSALRGDWLQAKKWCDQAAATIKSDPSWRHLRHYVQIALHDTQAMEGEYIQECAGNELLDILSGMGLLCDSLASHGQIDKVRETYLGVMQRISGGQAISGVSSYDLQIDYLCGDLNTFLTKQSQLDAMPPSSASIQLLLASGKLDQVIAIPELEAIVEWTDLLAISLSCYLKGDVAEAKVWQQKCLVALQENSQRLKNTARLLGRETVPTKDEISDGIHQLGDAPLVLAYLAQKFPDHKIEFNTWAEKINVSRLPPYLLVQQAIRQP